MPAVPGPAAVRGDNPASALPHTQKVKILLLCGQKKGNLSQYVCIKPSQLLQLWRGGVCVCARSCHFFQLDAWTKVAWPSSVVYCFQSTQHRGTCTITFPRPQRTRVRRAQVGRDPQGPWSPAPGSTWDYSGTPVSIAQALPELHPAAWCHNPCRPKEAQQLPGSPQLSSCTSCTQAGCGTQWPTGGTQSHSAAGGERPSMTEHPPVTGGKG